MTLGSFRINSPTIRHVAKVCGYIGSKDDRSVTVWSARSGAVQALSVTLRMQIKIDMLKLMINRKKLVQKQELRQTRLCIVLSKSARDFFQSV